MTPTPKADPLARPRAVLRSGLIAVLVLAPLPFGSVQPWAVLAFQLASAVLAAGAILMLHLERGGLPRQARWALLAGAALVLIGMAQLIPLPTGAARVISGPTEEMRSIVSVLVPETATGSGVSSLSPPDTVDAVLRLLACLFVALAALVSIRSAAHWKQLGIAIAVSGGFQGLYGSAEYLSGHQHILGYAKLHFLDDATGTFINRNHFAGYLAMTLPFALALCFTRHRTDPSDRLSWRERLLRLDEPGTRLFLLGAVAAMLMWVGVLLSYSRGGLVAALVSTSLVSAGRLGRRTMRIGSALLLVPTILLLFAEVRAPGERLAALSSGTVWTEGRIGIWSSSVEMIFDYPVLGSGFGTFGAAFPLFDAGTGGVTFSHAHNDWLQTLAEGGPLALLILLALAIGVLRLAITSRLFTSERLLWQRAALASAGAISLHGLVDFPVRIPAIALLLAAVLGAFFATPPAPPEPAPAPARWPGRVAG